MKHTTILAAIGIIIVVGAIGYAVSSSGNTGRAAPVPQYQSQDDIDYSETMTLSLIDAALKHHFDAAGSYPKSLRELVVPDHLSGVSLIDARTGAPFDYTQIDDGIGYLLCHMDRNGQSQCVGQ